MTSTPHDAIFCQGEHRSSLRKTARSGSGDDDGRRAADDAQGSSQGCSSSPECAPARPPGFAGVTWRDTSAIV